MEWMSRFVDTARAQGLSAIGFSEHPHRFRECRATYAPHMPGVDDHCTERLDSYLRLVDQARQARLPVKVALEWDYLPGYEAELERAIGAHPWDYTIGSVHWLPPDDREGEWWGFDNPAHRHEWERRDVLAVYRQYFRLIAAAARTGLFDIIGHADVIKVFGYRPKEDISELYQQAAAAFAEAGVCVEINTAGRRKPVGEIYPAPPFLRACRLAGVPILINSDAHIPEDVAMDFDRAADCARQAGYTQVATFTGRTRAMAALE